MGMGGGETLFVCIGTNMILSASLYAGYVPDVILQTKAFG